MKNPLTALYETIDRNELSLNDCHYLFKMKKKNAAQSKQDTTNRTNEKKCKKKFFENKKIRKNLKLKNFLCSPLINDAIAISDDRVVLIAEIFRCTSTIRFIVVFKHLTIVELFVSEN